MHHVVFVLVKPYSLRCRLAPSLKFCVNGILYQKQPDKRKWRKISSRCKKAVGVTGIFPCGAGFEQSNPLLVRPIPRCFWAKKTRSTDCRLRPVLRIRSVVNQLGIDDFSGTILNVIHTAHPFHLVGCFECFGDTFGCRHLTYQLRKQLFRLLIYIVEIAV